MASFGAVIAALAAVSLCAAGPATAATPAQELVSTYSPVTMLRAQENGPCDIYEEQFRPTTVDVMLGNPAVELQRDTPKGLKTITTAPTAKQIAGLGQNYYLNVPGDPLE